MRYLLLLLLLPFSLHSQPKITLTGPAVRPGAPASVTVTLSGGLNSIAALQWSTVALPGMTVTPGAALASGKSVTCASAGGLFTCVAWGGAAAIPDGVLASIAFPAPALAPSLLLSNALGVNPAGDVGILIASGAPFTLPLLSPCDLNGDGKTDLLDARNVIDQIDGVVPAVTDLNGDGKTTVVELQRISNAIDGGACRVGQ